MQNINNNIMRTECPIDMKQTALEQEFHCLHYMPKKAKTQKTKTKQNKTKKKNTQTKTKIPLGETLWCKHSVGVWVCV